MEEQIQLKEGSHMAEEVKQEQKKAEASKAMSTILKVILGLAFLALGILAILKWWPDLLTIVKGCIGLFLVLAGIITLAIAKE
jgi:fatty acid desaturase